MEASTTLSENRHEGIVRSAPDPFAYCKAVSGIDSAQPLYIPAGPSLYDAEVKRSCQTFEMLRDVIGYDIP